MKEVSRNCQGICPKCYSGDVSYIDQYPEEDYFCYIGICSKCGTKFNEWFHLNYAETIYYGEEDENIQ